MNDRELVFSSVRAALGRSGDAVPDIHPPRVDDSLARLAGPDIDLGARFIDAATRTGMKPARASRASLRESLESIVRAEAPCTVLVDVADGSLRTVANDACQALTISTRSDPDARAFDADLAIIDASAGVAETGSVLLTSNNRRRCSWIVPPKVVILVRAGTLVPDLLDLWTSPESAAHALALAPPAAMLLVSGPSKTADIEGVLVTGVHGPGTVYIVLINDA
ncbi:MAG: LUD domain-containing protein [Phycisphaerae bacterium]|nr:LUD domain-containing protein [Phycisphaerae bacterium]